MAGIVRISTNTPWEPIAGYSRAVRAGDWVSISGTTATDERGSLVGIGQMYVQAKQAIANLSAALGRLSLDAGSIVRTRIFVTDISRFEEVARAHREAFGDSRPATTMIEVSRLAHPDMLIEIEADAYAGATERTAIRSEESRPLPEPSRHEAPKLSAQPSRPQVPKPKTPPKAKPHARPKVATRVPPRKPAKRR